MPEVRETVLEKWAADLFDNDLPPIFTRFCVKAYSLPSNLTGFLLVTVKVLNSYNGSKKFNHNSFRISSRSIRMLLMLSPDRISSARSCLLFCSFWICSSIVCSAISS